MNDSIITMKRLGDILELQRGYDLPTSKRTAGEVPIISSSGYSGYHNEYKCEGENVITGRYGTIGGVYYHSGKCWPLNTALFVKDFKGNTPKYVYYLLKNALSVYRVSGNDKSAVPGVDRKVIHEMLVPFHENMNYQQTVCSVLTCIDDKININNQIGLLLEAMAKTLYDYWFVQFDFPDENGRPYRTSGGEMVWNEQLKREIPKGWKTGNLYDIANFFNGIACQRFRPRENESGLPVIKIKEMHDGITTDTEFVTENIPDKNKVFDGDILFSWSATLEVMYWFGGNGGLNQHIFKVVPKGYFSNEYVYEQLSAYIINFVKMAEARKTTMGHITTDHLEQSRIVLPPEEVIKCFSEAAQPIHRKIGQARQENRELMKLRDWLLPMLMNGQARVE